MRTFLFVIVVLFQVSCHNSTGKNYNPNTFQSDIQEIRQEGKLNDDELQQLTRYIVLAHLQGVDLKGKTYGDILELLKDATKSITDASDYKANVEKSKRQRINPRLQVTLLSKTFLTTKDGTFIQYKISITNSTLKNIRTIIGNFSIQDLMEKEIKNVPVILKQNIHGMSNETLKIDAVYDEASEQDRRLRSKNFTDIRIVWNPEKIIFEDGKLLE